MGFLFVSGLFLGPIYTPIIAESAEATTTGNFDQSPQYTWNVEYAGQIGEIAVSFDIEGSDGYVADEDAGFLASRGIDVSVNQIWIDAGSQTVFVSVSADLSSLLPGFLDHRGVYTVTGFARARMQGTP